MTRTVHITGPVNLSTGQQCCARCGELLGDLRYDEDYDDHTAGEGRVVPFVARTSYPPDVLVAVGCVTAIRIDRMAQSFLGLTRVYQGMLIRPNAVPDCIPPLSPSADPYGLRSFWPSTLSYFHNSRKNTLEEEARRLADQSQPEPEPIDLSPFANWRPRS